jgi:hypothetical protein
MKKEKEKEKKVCVTDKRRKPRSLFFNANFLETWGVMI